jgi:fucose 4-O-acetylase-like acetyltransferase
MKLQWILIAKGIGIILVVIGHFWPADSPVYWTEVRRIMYTFHMPLFFILSGWLYQHGKYSYCELMSAKTQRLLYPFATTAIFFLFIKLSAGMFFNLENPVDLASACTILINPYKSYAPPLWYVHSLFIIFAAYPFLRRVCSDILLLMLFTVLNIFLNTDTAFCGKTLHNIPFFITGIIFRNNEMTLARWLNGSVFVVLVLSFLFIVSCFSLKFYFPLDTPSEYPMVLISGVCGSMLTIILSRKIAMSSARIICALLAEMGIYSMSIYLFHTLFESSARIILMQTFREFKLPFELVLVISVTCGLIFPLALEKYFLRKNRVARKFLLGLP